MANKMASDLTIRDIVVGDVKDVVEILTSRRVCEKRGLDARLKSVIENPQGICIVAEFDGRIVGVLLASYDGFHVFLGKIGVLKEYEGRGIGQALHAEMLSRGCELNMLGVIADSKLTATGFFYSLGYRMPGAVFLKYDS